MPCFKCPKSECKMSKKFRIAAFCNQCNTDEAILQSQNLIGKIRFKCSKNESGDHDIALKQIQKIDFNNNKLCTTCNKGYIMKYTFTGEAKEEHRHHNQQKDLKSKETEVTDPGGAFEFYGKKTKAEKKEKEESTDYKAGKIVVEGCIYCNKDIKN